MPLKQYVLLQIAKFGPSSGIRRRGFSAADITDVGDNVYIGPGMTTTPTAGTDDHSTQIYIGDRVAISPNVSFICSAHPEQSVLSEIYGRTDPITVGDDVWIGADVTILGGVEIGPRSVIGAGATVVDDVEPETVVGGTPAQKLKDVNWDNET